MTDYSLKAQKDFHNIIETIKLRVTLSEISVEEKKEFYQKLYAIERVYCSGLVNYLNENLEKARAKIIRKEDPFVLKIRETNRRLQNSIDKLTKVTGKLYLDMLISNYELNDKGIPKYLKNRQKGI